MFGLICYHHVPQHLCKGPCPSTGRPGLQAVAVTSRPTVLHRRPRQANSVHESGSKGPILGQRPSPPSRSCVQAGQTSPRRSGRTRNPALAPDDPRAWQNASRDRPASPTSPVGREFWGLAHVKHWRVVSLVGDEDRRLQAADLIGLAQRCDRVERGIETGRAFGVELSTVEIRPAPGQGHTRPDRGTCA